MNQTFDNLNLCIESVDELIAGLDESQWNTPSLCPDWTVKGVVQHLGGAEFCLTDWLPQAEDEMPPFELVGSYTDATSGLAGAELVERHRSVVAARQDHIGTLVPDDMDRRQLSPVGPATYGRFMRVRVFDWWVHEQDMRQPLGLAGHESGPAAEMALDEIEASLGYIVGKGIGLPDGRSITFDLTGPVERQMHVTVDGRAGQVDSLAELDVVVTADSTTFALLACGRIDPQVPIDAGAITWSGDDEWGERAARSLRFTR